MICTFVGFDFVWDKVSGSEFWPATNWSFCFHFPKCWDDRHVPSHLTQVIEQRNAGANGSSMGHWRVFPGEEKLVMGEQKGWAHQLRWAGMPEHHCEKGHRLVCWLLLSIWHKSWERREPQLWESSLTRLAYAAFSWLQIHVGSPACFEKAGLANHEHRTWKPVYQFLPWFPQKMFVTWK